MKIGWVGLGSIGTNMVKQALTAGHRVTAFARGQGMADVEREGATFASSYRDLAADADVLGICVFSDDQLREVLFDGGALESMANGGVVAMHTTGSPELAREIGARAPKGVGVMDATFSGGPADVLNRALTLMVGGDEEALARARALLECYADKIHHVGPLGSGQMLKLLNNLLFATNLKNAAELLRVAETLGLQPQSVANVLQSCSGGSFAMRVFQGGSTVAEALSRSQRYVEKDVATAAESGTNAGADMQAFAETIAYFKTSP